jgi:hypothetical protein
MEGSGSVLVNIRIREAQKHMDDGSYGSGSGTLDVWVALKLSDFSGPPLGHQIRANASDGGQKKGRNPLLPLRLRGVQHGGGLREGQEQAGHQPLPGRVGKNQGF